MLKKSSLAATLLLLTMAMAACVEAGQTYSTYKSVGSEGWQREDTVAITVGPVMHGGSYAEELGLRTNSRYPFTELAMIVAQQARPSGFSRTDTLCVRLTDDSGYVTGEGISHYQYLFPIPAAMLAEGDTLQVGIRHNMKRSPLAGVTDVGLTLKRSDL